MADEDVVAPSEATLEVARPDVAQDAAEGQVTPPASEEEKTKAQERRERRKAQEQRQRDEFDAAQRKASEAEARLTRVKQAAAGIEPKEADFIDIGEYWAAKGAFNYARQVAQTQVQEAATETDAAKAILDHQRAAQKQARQAVLQEEMVDARTRYADFDAVFQVAANPAVMNDQVAEMVLESDQPADLAYFLGKNPQVALQLSQMPPQQAVRELGRIEARLSVDAPKIVSKAPPPVNPIRPNGTAAKRPEDMTLAEFSAWREQGGAPSM